MEPRQKESAPMKKEQFVENEKKEARENFGALLDLVFKRYETPDSTIANSPEQIKTFKAHVEEVLNLCVERGIEKSLATKELKTLEVVAILHDLTKADRPDSDMKDIPNYMLAAHGELGAQEIIRILGEHPKVLEKILNTGYSPQEADKTTKLISSAIRAHMGPHPGFMTFVLGGVNAKLKEKSLPELQHPRPLEGEAISETLLAADMRSLAGRKGREKVLAIRSAVPNFKREDEELCAEYKKHGINLVSGEAALLSAFASAEQARDMLRNEDDRLWIDTAIEASKEENYFYEDQSVNYAATTAKKEKFEKASKDGRDN
ncbi:MAG: hypothetical protein CO002_00160 [Candidatus Portnoybacteria bacterium CG_4_8_14_3_um_filter_44_10]|uniref:HD domain-containing protein n=1 Tax=Candidatus Portnoybacteria bacterium CG_4_8_14_3_um_filter_44_10 TaxID=1974802 RepID=A0A2M7IGX2_9BACT|nr:MAG: hypothetical protein CO002_00160 [Candidatus Portnoybacteria bacterium CG_4_8_14_3_um_filter_44_10]